MADNKNYGVWHGIPQTEKGKYYLVAVVPLQPSLVEKVMAELGQVDLEILRLDELNRATEPENLL